MLSGRGHEVFAYALDRAELSKNIIRGGDISELRRKFDCIILPIPAKADGGRLNAPFASAEYPLDEIFSLFSPGQTVIGGKLSNSMFEFAGKSGVRLFDCLEREDFTVMNSLLTAEGAIEVVMRETPFCISGAKILVIGFGHIGKILAQKLKALDAEVSATARRSGDLALIEAYGIKQHKTAALRDIAADFDVLINTVPACVVTADVLSNVRRDAFVLDLASKPGGVDFEAAQTLGVKAVRALSLPGRAAPATAAKALCGTVLNILEEWGVCG